MIRTTLVIGLVGIAFYVYSRIQTSSQTRTTTSIEPTIGPVVLLSYPKHIQVPGGESILKNIPHEEIKRFKRELTVNLKRLISPLHDLIFDYLIVGCPGFQPTRGRARNHALYYICFEQPCSTQFLVLGPTDFFDNMCREYGCDVFIVNGNTKKSERVRFFGCDPLAVRPLAEIR